MKAAVDLGLTNIDIIIAPDQSEWSYYRFCNTQKPVLAELEAALQSAGFAPASFETIAVTSGQYRALPAAIGATRLLKVNEVEAIARGGLFLAGMDEAIVVSAGSGTAVIAARPHAARQWRRYLFCQPQTSHEPPGVVFPPPSLLLQSKFLLMRILV